MKSANGLQGVYIERAKTVLWLLCLLPQGSTRSRGSTLSWRQGRLVQTGRSPKALTASCSAGAYNTKPSVTCCRAI